MASIRRVRKDFRKEVLSLIQQGDGNIETLLRLAGDYFGRDVGYEVVLRAFLGSEVGHAVAYLRNEGLVESVGKLWKPASELDDNYVARISNRRFKRIRGELKQGIKLAHDHGLVEDAVMVSKMLETMLNRLPALEPEPETADVS
jgi:hypothetical protein